MRARWRARDNRSCSPLYRSPAEIAIKFSGILGQKKPHGKEGFRGNPIIRRARRPGAPSHKVLHGHETAGQGYPTRVCMVNKRRPRRTVPHGFTWQWNGGPGSSRPTHLPCGYTAGADYPVGATAHKVLRGNGTAGRGRTALHTYLEGTPQRRIHPKFPTAAPIRPVQAWAGQWYQCRRPLSSHRPPGCTPPQRCRSDPARPGCVWPGG